MVVQIALVLALVMVPASVLAQQKHKHQHAHQHGVAKMNVAVDGPAVVVELESPLDNLVGFEHAPRTDKQRAALRQMEERLQAGDRMLRPAAAAGCTVRAVTIDHPYRDAAAAGAKDGKASPASAAASGAKDQETHAELRATWELECTNPEALGRMEVLLFETFPRMKQIRAQTVSPRGQSSRTLTTRDRGLPF